MRLRLTVRRHRVPETRVIWAIDTASNPTTFNLLEHVNETIPIESDGEWGLEDYAVELKGNNGVNYECLHFQPLANVMKDEDEVIIRPLLTQDIKIRRISGRVQISADGKHLVDGVAWGRPLLRQADRPPVTIPPRKRQRITYGEDDEDPEGFKALQEKEAEKSEDNGNRQLVLHADFEDDDEEDDDDFVPGKDEDAEDEESEEDLQDENEKDKDEDEEEPPTEPHASVEETDDADEPPLADVKDQATRAKIRKLHSAFPKSPLAVCKYVLNGSEDIGEAYEAMARGFIPVKSKSAITEISQGVNHGSLSVPKTRSKAKTPSVNESENLYSMQVEADESQNALIDYYDQNGLPEGCIKSGKALSFMAEALKSSPGRPRSEPKRSASVVSNKSVRFALNGSFSNGLTSTPFIDKESQVDEEEESEEDSDEESDESSSEDSSNSEDSSDSSDNEAEEANDSSDGSSSSESDSESSRDSSSEDESPEEASSKQAATAPAKLTAPLSSQEKEPTTKPRADPGQGTRQTRARNQRRRDANVLDRFKKKGILPAGITISEFYHLEVGDKTLPENASAALETLRAAKKSQQISDSVKASTKQKEEFERRRHELLASLASGGIEVDTESLRNVQNSPPAKPAPDVEMGGMKNSVNEILESQQVAESQHGVELKQSVEVQQNAELRQSIESQQNVDLLESIESEAPGQSQDVVKPLSTALDHHEPAPASNQIGVTEVEIARPSSAPGLSTIDTSLTSPKPPPASVESSQPSSSRRAKLDVGATRRLMFSSLGIKPPKTKKDEEKVRSEFMKDVRPPLLSKTTVVAETNHADEAADEDHNAWREKVNYRAVECVQEGVVLSEPPFPFVQRWDPQQQGSWSQKGNRGGKRKKDQRDQAQYYHDDTRASKKQKRRKGKHNYAEQQGYIDASYEPSYQDDTMTSQVDDSTQAELHHSDDVEGEINQQLMNDIQTPTTGFSQAPEDLASLPDDPSTLAVLKDGRAKVGMTIAFKKLEMSEATKWQPQVSAYRTAIVVDITESGELQLTLAMRDREQSSKRYDQETGERIYSKFEAPDDDEMDEGDNDGMLNLQFRNLIDPKIVQEPPPNLGGDVVTEEASQAKQFTSFDTITFSHEEEAGEDHSEDPAQESAGAQFSHVTETPLNSDMPEPREMGQVMGDASDEPSVVVIPPINISIAAPNTPTTEVPACHSFGFDNLTESNAEENRQNIAQMMRDDGFRSSVQSEAFRLTLPGGTVSPGGADSPSNAEDLEESRQNMSESPSKRIDRPKLNGLGSSSLARKSPDASKSPEKDTGKESPQIPPQSSWETVDEPPNSPPKQQQDSSSWVIEKSQEEPPVSTSFPTFTDKVQEESPVSAFIPAAPELTQPKSEKKALMRKAPIGKAQQLWQMLQPHKRSPTPDSAAESSKTSLSPGLGLDGADDRDVQYPKLSAGSSFTSNVADHERQPDSVLEDTVDLSADTPKGPDLDTNGLSHSPQRDFESERAHSLPVDDLLSDNEPGLPPRESVNKPTPLQRKTPDILKDDPSSDGLPEMEEIIFSQRSIKRETITPAPAKNSIKKDAEHRKVMDALDEESFGEDQTTLKVSQKRRSVSTSRSSKNRQSEKAASHPRASVPRASQLHPSQSKSKFEIPKGSQVMDLTLSSDVEPEPSAEEEDSDLAPPRRKRYDVDDDDDSYQDEHEHERGVGWVRKKTSTIRGVETRRHTSVGLRDSSQASLNTRNRGKTTAR